MDLRITNFFIAKGTSYTVKPDPFIWVIDVKRGCKQKGQKA